MNAALGCVHGSLGADTTAHDEVSSHLDLCAELVALQRLAQPGHAMQVQRIGKYKSAGDQLLRRDMSEAQKEQLSALLDDIYDEFVTSVAQVWRTAATLDKHL